MAQKQGSTQNTRTSKTSGGTARGAKKTRLLPIELILMNKGMAHQGKRRPVSRQTSYSS